MAERAKLQSVGFNAHPSNRLAVMFLAVVSTDIPLKKKMAVVASVQTIARCDRLAKVGRLVRTDSTW